MNEERIEPAGQDSSTHPSNLQQLRALAKAVPLRPGIYKLLAADKKILYIGKARRLQTRLLSHFSGRATNTRIALMLSKVVDFQTTLTRSESEALLLEDKLIKEHRPPYNIMLRDDKSFPYIRVSQQHEYPGIYFHRGARGSDDTYLGPWPSAKSVRGTMRQVQKIFKLRNCSESVFAHRTRPCLEYQIGRCSAPCVGFIPPQEYATDTGNAIAFMRGEDSQVAERLAEDMELAVKKLDFERAARLRDRIRLLSNMRRQQTIVSDRGDADALTCRYADSQYAIGLVVIRDGDVIDTSTHFMQVPDSSEQSEEGVRQVLESFITQWYLLPGTNIPSNIYTDPKPKEPETLAQILSDIAGHKVQLYGQGRGKARGWLELGASTVLEKLRQNRWHMPHWPARWKKLAQNLGWSEEKSSGLAIDCLDVSHHRGEHTVVSAVSFDANGRRQEEWRLYRIPEPKRPGDDYAALREAVIRRFKGGLDAKHPRLLLIDGGLGQVRLVKQALIDIQTPALEFLGIAKGVGRKPGLEKFLFPDGRRLELPPQDGARLLLQHIRDEAHRFAIQNQRKGLRKKRKESDVESLPGIGPHTRRALLHRFGGWKELKTASREELQSVSGIGVAKATILHEYLRGSKT